MNRPLKPILGLLAVLVITLVLSISVAIPATAPPFEGGQLPEVNLLIPDNPEDRRYLGLSGGGSFQIPQIKAQVVIIEIFSMYCPYCQREAPEINRLYRAIENDPALKGKMKLLGIGAGNTPFEVEVFRKKYNVPFPLFPDEDFTAHKCLGEMRTPYFITIEIKDEGSHQVIYSKLGSIEAADQFLKLMIQRSGLEGGDAK